MQDINAIRDALRRKQGLDLAPQPMNAPQWVNFDQNDNSAMGGITDLASVLLNKQRDPLKDSLGKINTKIRGSALETPPTPQSAFNVNLPQMQYQPMQYRQGGSTLSDIGRLIRFGEDRPEVATDEYGNKQLLNDGTGVPTRPSYIDPNPSRSEMASALLNQPNDPPIQPVETRPRRVGDLSEAIKRMSADTQSQPLETANNPNDSNLPQRIITPEMLDNLDAHPEMQAEGTETRGRYTTPEAQLEARINNRERLMSDPSLKDAPENHPSRVRSAIVNGLLGIADTARTHPYAGAEVLLGGIAPSVAGIINPKMLADYENQQEIAPMQGMLDRQNAMKDKQLQREHLEAETNEIKGRPAREAAKAQRELQAKIDEEHRKDDRDWTEFFTKDGKAWKRFKDGRADEAITDPASGEQLSDDKKKTYYVNGVAGSGEDVIRAGSAAQAADADAENKYRQAVTEHDKQVAELKGKATAARQRATQAKATRDQLIQMIKDRQDGDATPDEYTLHEGSQLAALQKDERDAAAEATQYETQASALPVPQRQVTPPAPAIGGAKPVKTEEEWRAEAKKHNADPDELVRRARANGQVR